MIKKTIDNFDLEKIADSGQIFRMNKNDDGSFCVISKDKFLKISQNKNKISFYCSKKDFKDYWEIFFDLKKDYKKIEKIIDKKDKFLSAAFSYGKGIRILNQDLFETIVSFIISQQNNIPKIKNTIEKMCKKLGKKIKDKETGVEFYAFPTPKKLSKLENLEGLSLGYRDKYIATFCQNLGKNEAILGQKFKNLSYEESKKELKNIFGVGEKVANCVLLFSLGFINAFPEDVWIKKVIKLKYNGKFPYKRYDDFLGIIQQYLFYFAKNTKI